MCDFTEGQWSRAFASRSLSERKRHYHACEKECCGILFALKKFEYYIDGQEVEPQTYNEALIWINKMRDVNSKFVRWALRIQDFQPVITHCPSRLNVVADALSWAPVEPSKDVDEYKEAMHLPTDCNTPSLLATLTSDITLDSLRESRKEIAKLNPKYCKGVKMA